MILLCALLWALQPYSNMHTLTVTVQNIPRAQGQVMLALFNKADGFPSGASYKTQAVAVQGNMVTARFDNLPPGTYAVAVYHDANSNGKLDTNFLGIPQEAYGASNNVSSLFSAPKFKDAQFELQGDREIQIRL